MSDVPPPDPELAERLSRSPSLDSLSTRITPEPSLNDTPQLRQAKERMARFSSLMSRSMLLLPKGEVVIGDCEKTMENEDAALIMSDEESITQSEEMNDIVEINAHP